MPSGDFKRKCLGRVLEGFNQFLTAKNQPAIPISPDDSNEALIVKIKGFFNSPLWLAIKGQAEKEFSSENPNFIELLVKRLEEMSGVEDEQLTFKALKALEKEGEKIWDGLNLTSQGQNSLEIAVGDVLKNITIDTLQRVTVAPVASAPTWTTAPRTGVISAGADDINTLVLEIKKALELPESTVGGTLRRLSGQENTNKDKWSRLIQDERQEISLTDDRKTNAVIALSNEILSVKEELSANKITPEQAKQRIVEKISDVIEAADEKQRFGSLRKHGHVATQLIKLVEKLEKPPSMEAGVGGVHVNPGGW